MFEVIAMKQSVYLELTPTMKRLPRAKDNKYVMFEIDEQGFSAFLTKQKSTKDRTLLFYTAWTVLSPELKEKASQDLQSVGGFILNMMNCLYLEVIS